VLLPCLPFVKARQLLRSDQTLVRIDARLGGFVTFGSTIKYMYI
jgi:hypothetical protein